MATGDPLENGSRRPQSSTSRTRAWRDQAGNEVDLLIKGDRRLVAVECRLSEIPAVKDTREIERLRRFYGAEVVQQAFIATPADVACDLAPGVSTVCG